MSISRKHIPSEVIFTIFQFKTVNQLAHLTANGSSLYNLLIKEKYKAHTQIWKPLCELAFPNQEKRVNESYYQALVRFYENALGKIKRDINAFAMLSDYLKNDVGFARAAIKQSHIYKKRFSVSSPLIPVTTVIGKAGINVRNDKELVRHALKGVKMLRLNTRQLQHIVELLGEKLKKDTGFLVNELGVCQSVASVYSKDDISISR
jgi:hypothetical protein